MTNSNIKGPDEQIIQESVEDLIRIIGDSKQRTSKSLDSDFAGESNIPPAIFSQNSSRVGDYVFLVGAGVSRPEPAGIPTASELIEQWQDQEYDDKSEERETLFIKGIDESIDGVSTILENHDLADLDPSEAFSLADEETRKAVFVKVKESEMMDFQNEYGFWFQERYSNQDARRKFILDLVEDSDPPFGMVVLGLLMESNYVPITLTPNFDDVLFDAFYQFLDQKPQVINYDAIASQFKVTSERPTIVKLHGDHLNYNLRNTGPETYELSNNIRDAISRTLREYGLVVIGYGGQDESIMGVLDDLQIPSQGIYWCARDRDELSDRAENLLKEPNTFFVEIEGSDEFFTQLLHQIGGLHLPIPDKIEELGEERAKLYDNIVRKQQKEAVGEARQIFDEYQVISKVSDLVDGEDYDQAIEELNELIDLGQRSGRLFYERGSIKQNKGDHSAAINDFDESLAISDAPAARNSRGISKLQLGQYDSAINDFERAIDLVEDAGITSMEQNIVEARILKGEYEGALEGAENIYNKTDSIDTESISLLQILITKLVLEMDYEEEEQQFRELFSKEFPISWSFEELEHWLAECSLDEEKLQKINEWVELLREHRNE